MREDHGTASETSGSGTAATAPADVLAAKIGDRTARICVVGLGYVGLPLARAFTDGGFAVLGFDVDGRKVSQLRDGRSYVAQLPDSWVAELVESGRFVPTEEESAFAEADVVVICVPTPLTQGQDPDLRYVEQTGRTIARNLRPGQLVVLESTTYPGTTDGVLQPILDESGLAIEQDYFLAYSPEREDPGNAHFTTRTIPKVVGGCGARGHELACALYGAVVDEVVPVADSRVAEASKILENTYRAVNIALVNELKVLFDKMGIDVWGVIEAAKTKPFGFQAFYPGPGLGGHCIPIDPFYLSWLAKQQGMETRFIDLAGRVNTDMPMYVVERIAAVLNERGIAVKGSKVLVLGLSYKADIDDSRESPAFPILEALAERGAETVFHDPYFETFPEKRDYDMAVERVELTEDMVRSQDLVVIVTAHSSYDMAWLADHAKAIVDTRGAMRDLGPRDNVFRA